MRAGGINRAPRWGWDDVFAVKGIFHVTQGGMEALPAAGSCASGFEVKPVGADGTARVIPMRRDGRVGSRRDY